MTNGRPISEEDLHAYVDGLLDPERHQRVDRYLAEHPEVLARIQAWQQGGEALRQALVWKAKEPVPASLSLAHLVEARIARHRAPWRLVAGILIGLIIGSGVGWIAHGPVMPTGVAALGMEAAAATRVFASDRIPTVAFGPKEQAQLVDWAAQHLGRQITPPDLTRAGYHLIGGRLVATVHGAGCMFLYGNEKGQRVTLFVRPMEGHDMNAPMRPIDAQDAAGYTWAHHGMGFSLVSAHPMPTLHQLSDHVRDVMDAGA